MNGSLNRALLLASASFLFAGPALAKKKKKNKDAEEEAAPAAQATPDVPDDGNSKKFASKLIETSITDFRPSDGGGATFKYSSLSFIGDNTWKADAYVEIQDERMECIESGGWTMEPAESSTVGTVTWELESTDCPGRESGGKTRVQFTLTKNGVDAIFR